MKTKDIVCFMEPVIRYPDAFNSNHVTRIRRQACVYMFGTPNANASLLPRLEKELKDDGHDFSYETLSGNQMRATMIA